MIRNSANLRVLCASALRILYTQQRIKWGHSPIINMLSKYGPKQSRTSYKNDFTALHCKLTHTRGLAWVYLHEFQRLGTYTKIPFEHGAKPG